MANTKRKPAKQIDKRHQVIIGDGSGLPARISYTEAERAGVHAQKARIRMRAEIGKDWDGKSANDNVGWPLATALVREGNQELLKAAMAYRKLHDTAHSNALLGGTSVVVSDGFALDRYTYVREDGSIAYRHARVRRGADADMPARRYMPLVDEDCLRWHGNSVKIQRAWNGDRPVHDKLDAQRKLVEMRGKLGPLVEPLEMAVIDCATYQEIGRALGVANRAGAMGAGRATVHMALVVVRDSIGKITREDLSRQ